ncbi:MAG: Fe-S cluster assembly protein SufD [Bacteroidales bacterium]
MEQATDSKFVNRLVQGPLSGSFTIQEDDPLKDVRSAARQQFLSTGLPGPKDERWKHTGWEHLDKYDFEIITAEKRVLPSAETILQCEVPDFDTELMALYNGWYVGNGSNLKQYPGGMIAGSILQALQEMPDLVLPWFNKLAANRKDGFVYLNRVMANDGLFIYMPKGATHDKPVQLVNIINHNNPVLIQNMNLIILEPESELTLVHCDDSHNHEPSLSNTVTEVFMGQESHLYHYKLQNLNNTATLFNTTFFRQDRGAQLKSYAISLNGGMIRNDLNTELAGKESHADLYGLYLMDKEQHCDNRVFVDHAVADATSNELYKGILDDHATAVFNGHILVRRDAQHTQAYQNNRNLQLTDKAHVYTQPFLEIYADDVRCSHGATVGQLDEDAMFYIQSRGISEHNARMLLMYAFAAEVVRQIHLEPLHRRVDDLVKKRLRGELAICDQCVLHCSNQEKQYDFQIDLSKI